MSVRVSWLTLVMTLAVAALALLAGPADAATRTFPAVKKQGQRVTFKPTGLDPARIASARVRSGATVIRVARSTMRRAARRGTLTLRIKPAVTRRARAAARKKTRLIVTITEPAPTVTDPASAPAPAPAPADTTAPAAPAPVTPTLLWADEFAGPAGSPPDAANWNIATGANYNGGNDHVAYTSRPENVSRDGLGNLAITVRRETMTMNGVTRDYTSGRINSGGLRAFAPPVRFEARIQVPTESGLVPAFWTLGANYGPWGSGPVTWPDTGEIDALEVTNDPPSRARYHLHGPDASGELDRTANRDVSIGGGYTDSADLDTSFHVYGVDVLADRIDFLFDGVVRWSVTRSQYEAAGGRWAGVFDQAHYLVLNVGSLYSWGGDPTFTGSRQMLVDWVRASRL